MNIEDELLQLARERENQTQAGLQEMPPFAPDYLQRQLRLYLVSQAENYDRMKHPDDRVPQLTRPQDDLYKLACPKAEFSDGGLLSFNGSERESDETATFTQLSSPAELRGTDVGHRHPLGHG